MNVSRETSERLQAYLSLLRRWSPRINLVSPATLEDAWHRHVEDSLQLLRLRPEPGPHWTDLGSGGGLPGLVVAIAAPDPATRFTLIESDKRKAAFLRRVVGALSLNNTTVLPQRIESATPQMASTVSARALAPLPTLVAYVQRHLAHDGTALLPKGACWREELRAAEARWRFACVPHDSVTQPGAAILEITSIHER